MVVNEKNIKGLLICNSCDKKFGTLQKLERHTRKKIPCGKVIKCDKCNRVFNRTNDLTRHLNRKTPCEPIQGDPTKQTPENTCHFCYKKFKSKYGLKNHYDVCKIKNGGMALLFKKVEKLEKENEKMKEQITKGVGGNTIVHGNQNNQNQNINVQNIANHNNTTFNFTLINFGEGQEEIVKILSKEAPGLLSAEHKMDLPYIKQVQDRIIGLIMKVHRNPERKELQNIYVTDTGKPNNNAFKYEEGKWKITDWDKLNKIILNNLYNNLLSAKITAKQDKLKVMKHIFVEGGCGDNATIEKMSDDDIGTMYLEIGNKLNFKTISL